MLEINIQVQYLPPLFYNLKVMNLTSGDDDEIGTHCDGLVVNGTRLVKEGDHSLCVEIVIQCQSDLVEQKFIR